MDFLFNIIAVPMRYVLQFFNDFCGSYALAILLFTIIVNSLMIPLSIKQQKSTAKQARLRPKLDELKAKFGDDRMKFSTAQSELFQKEGVSATSGCLPMIIRMLVLIGVYQAVRELITLGNGNFSLFGLNLASQPVWDTNVIKMMTGDPIWIIPFISFGTSLLSMLISNAQQKRNNPQMAQAGNSMFVMMLIMPVFSLIIAFGVPGAVGYYWVISNVVNTGIQMIVNTLYYPDKLVAIEIANDGLKRRKLERQKTGK